LREAGDVSNLWGRFFGEGQREWEGYREDIPLQRTTPRFGDKRQGVQRAFLLLRFGTNHWAGPETHEYEEHASDEQEQDRSCCSHEDGRETGKLGGDEDGHG